MKRRNRVAQWLANLALRRLATPEYRLFIDGSIRYGMNAAARDLRAGIPQPSPWDES